jgi:diaminopimelate decarboxylase
VYCGSGNSLTERIANLETLFRLYNEHRIGAAAINFAGGHGFVYDEWAEESKHFDWSTYFSEVRRLAAAYAIPETVEFLFEPARDVLADVGVLLLKVERDVITNFVGSLVVTNGSRMLMPSAQQRDRRHNVAFLDREMRESSPADGAHTLAAVRGRSILRHDYILPGTCPVPEAVDARSHMLHGRRRLLRHAAHGVPQHPAGAGGPDRPQRRDAPDQRAGDDLDKWRNVIAEPRPISSARESEGGCADLERLVA